MRRTRTAPRRFPHVEEQRAARGRAPADADLDEPEALWGEAKKAECGQAE